MGVGRPRSYLFASIFLSLRFSRLCGLLDPATLWWRTGGQRRTTIFCNVSSESSKPAKSPQHYECQRQKNGRSEATIRKLLSKTSNFSSKSVFSLFFTLDRICLTPRAILESKMKIEPGKNIIQNESPNFNCGPRGITEYRSVSLSNAQYH